MEQMTNDVHCDQNLNTATDDNIEPGNVVQNVTSGELYIAANVGGMKKDADYLVSLETGNRWSNQGLTNGATFLHVDGDVTISPADMISEDDLPF